MYMVNVKGRIENPRQSFALLKEDEVVSNIKLHSDFVIEFLDITFVNREKVKQKCFRNGFLIFDDY